MKKLFVFCVLATALSAQGAINVAATKQYVDAKDAATLEASTNYTDAVAITKADLVQYSVVTNGSAVVTNAIPVVYSNVLTQVVSGYVGTNDFIDATNDLATAINSKASPSDIYDAVTNKADKVNSATNGHFAALNSSGNLMDSGIAASDVLVNNGTVDGGITFNYHRGESSSQLDGLGLIIDDSLSGYKAFYNADRIDLAFNYGSLYSLQFPTRGGILALTSDLSRYVGTNDFITATNGLATAINSKASPSDITVKSVKLNGTAITPDATGAVNVQALPLTGGNLTGGLYINGSDVEIQVGNGGVDDQHARLSRSELQVSDGAVSNTKLAHYLYDRIQVTTNDSTYTLTLPLATGTLAIVSQIYDAVTNIAPAWVSGMSYAANRCVSYRGVVYQNTSGSTISSTTTPNTSDSGWTAKKVSDLFLPLTGGTMTGGLAISNASIAFLSSGAIKARVMPSIFGSGLYISNENSTANVILPLNSSGTIALLQNLAADYSASATYTLNQLCVYDNKLYRCTTAITTAEAWTAAHWTEATVEDVLAAIRSALNDKAPLVSPAFTGTPTAPTPSSGDNSTNIATTAFVKSETLGNSGYQILEGTLGIATNKNAQGEVRYNNITDITPYGMRITDHWTRILLGGSGREPFTTTYGYKQIAVKAGFEEEKIIAIPAESGTMALLSDIYDAVTNIAPAWVSGMSYAANRCVSYRGVVYQNTSGSTISSTTTPNTSDSGWTAKKVSELFLPLTGGTMTGPISGTYFYANEKIYADNGYHFGGAEYAGIDIDRIYVGANSYDWAQRSGTFALLQNLAPDFSTSATYAVGQLCVYNKKLYRCTTAITTAEAWTAAHWTEATVEDVLAAIWTALGEIPSWAKATNKPSYNLNEVCPDFENWLGVPGTTAAGKSIKVLAKTVNGVIEGGLTVTGSSNNDNNITKYRYGGVTVTRNGVVTDYLFDTTSESGIVRRSELNDKAPLASPAFTGTPTAPTPTSGDNSTNVATTAFIQGALPYAIATVYDDSGYLVVSDRCVNRFDATSFASATINIVPPGQTAGKARDFYVAITCGATIPSVAVVGAFIDYTLINSKGESADLTLTANATTVLHFTEIANGSTGVRPVFVVTGGANGVTPLDGQIFDFATTQGVMDALKTVIEALGGSVTNAPSTTISQGE